MEPSAEDDKRQTSQWYDLYDLLADEMGKYGTEGIRPAGDFWIDTDNYGTLQHKIYIRNLELMKPSVIKSLQYLLRKYSGWEIVYQVSVPGPGDAWPDMCLIIRSHEVIDFLQRQFFPPDYQAYQYDGSRPPTAVEMTYYSQ